MSTYMFTSTSTSTSTSNMSTFSYFENAGDALSRMQSSLHLYPLRAHFLSLSPSILWLRVFSPGGRSTSPLTCRATHVCRVRLQSYAPTVALRHSCLFLSLREPLSPSLLVHSATRRPISPLHHFPQQFSPSLRSRRASDLAEPQISPSSSRLRCRRASSFASASSAPTRTLATTSCAIVC